MRAREKIILSLAWIGAVGAIFATSGCVVDVNGQGDDRYASVSGSCQIADDQQGTFMARVSEFPVPVIVDAKFQGRERDSIHEAVEKWNRLGEELIHEPFFRLQDGEALAHFPDLKSCGNEISAPANALLLVREGNSTDWDAFRRNPNMPAANSVGVTYRCSVGGRAGRQVTLIHAGAIGESQFSSVVLHELGHGLGLDHSCDLGAGRTGFRGCQGLSPAHAYHQAVMYPTLQMPDDGAGLAEIKDALQANDIARSRCQYGPR